MCAKELTKTFTKFLFAGDYFRKKEIDTDK